METQGATRDHARSSEDNHRVNPAGLLLVLLGVAGYTVSVFLHWLGQGKQTGVVDSGPGERTVNGYDLNTVLPLLALLGIGLLIALIYAYGKAAHGQHRGLSLVTMAVGLATVGMAVCYLIDPPGVNGLANNLSTKIGPFVALASAAIWSIGAGLLANGTEGDHHDGHPDQHANVTSYQTASVPSAVDSRYANPMDQDRPNVRPTGI